MSSSRIVTIPNVLTIVRMVLIPVFVSALYYQRFGLALGIFVVAGLTDGVDGFLARRFNQGSQLGQILDPIADKLLLVTSFITLSSPGVIAKTNHLPVPFWVTSAVVGRDVFIVVGAAAINVVTGFRGFRPSKLGKLNTVVQITAVFIILVCARCPALRGYLLPSTYTVVAALAAVSGVHYAFWVSRLMNEERTPRGGGRTD
jgi:cardiolipin synthase